MRLPADQGEIGLAMIRVFNKVDDFFLHRTENGESSWLSPNIAARLRSPRATVPLEASVPIPKFAHSSGTP